MTAETNEGVDVIIVHGVGYVERGRNRDEVQKLADKFWPNARVTEYCWDERVKRPVDGLDLDFNFFLQLGKSIRRAAWLGHDPKSQPTAASKTLMQLANLSASVLTYATLIGFVSVLLCSMIWIEQSFGLQRTPIWKEPTGEGSIFVTQVARLIVGSEAIYEHVFSATRLIGLAIGGSSAVALIFSTLARGIEGSIEELRRVFLICLWPAVWGLCVFAVFPFMALFGGFLLIVLPIFTTAAKVQLYEFSDGSLFWPAMLAGLIFSAIVGSVRLGSFLFSYQIKLLADIFLYLGDQNYREELLKGLRAELSAVEGRGNHLVVAGHSLGSVIAVDTLYSGCRAKSTTFVTMGSPIVRLFRRFFPSQVPKQSERLQEFPKRCPSFVWINIYRPLDWIGSSLGGEAPFFSERSTGQVRDPFSSHTGYWSDERVAGMLKSELSAQSVTRTESIRFSEVTLPLVGKQTPYECTSKPPKFAMAFAFWTLAWSLPVWSLIDNHILWPNEQTSRIEQRVSYLDEYGSAGAATVRPFKRTITERGPDGLKYFTSYDIILEWEYDGLVQCQKIKSQLGVDMPKLISKFDNPQTRLHHTREELTEYDSFKVQIIFDASNPKRFRLPEFGAKDFTSDGVAPIWELILPFCTPILATFLFWALTVPIWALYCGTRGPDFFWLPIKVIIDFFGTIF